MTISRYLFNFATHLIFSRWARNFCSHHDSSGGRCAAFVGVLHLEFWHNSALHHNTLYISIRLPTPWGKLYLGYALFQKAKTGKLWYHTFFKWWEQQLPTTVNDHASNHRAKEDNTSPPNPFPSDS